jgi:membrane protein involved in colicin uptake
MTTKQDIEVLLRPLPKRIQVEFALACAKSVVHLTTDKAPANAIALVELWLKDPGLVSSQELRCAADAAWAAADAAHAAWAAANAAANAAHAAWAAANAANAAWAAEASGKSLDDYKVMLLDMINSLTPVQKIIYNI